MLVACSDESVARTFQKRSVSSAAAEQTVSPSGESDMWSTCSPESESIPLAQSIACRH